jgi:hypothetical protein
MAMRSITRKADSSSAHRSETTRPYVADARRDDGTPHLPLRRRPLPRGAICCVAARRPCRIAVAI